MSAEGDVDEGKRVFARRLINETLSFLDQLRGQPDAQHKRLLHDVGSMPFEQIRDVGMVSSPGVVLESRDDGLHASRPTPAGVVDLGVAMELTAANTLTFNMFDGRHTLAEVADALATAMSWERETAQAHVRTLFVHLLMKGVCVPSAVSD
jgi:hypothetical protein